MLNIKYFIVTLIIFSGGYLNAAPNINIGASMGPYKLVDALNSITKGNNNAALALGGGLTGDFSISTNTAFGLNAGYFTSNGIEEDQYYKYKCRTFYIEPTVYFRPISPNIYIGCGIGLCNWRAQRTDKLTGNAEDLYYQNNSQKGWTPSISIGASYRRRIYKSFFIGGSLFRHELFINRSNNRMLWARSDPGSNNKNEFYWADDYNGAILDFNIGLIYAIVDPGNPEYGSITGQTVDKITGKGVKSKIKYSEYTIESDSIGNFVIRDIKIKKKTATVKYSINAEGYNQRIENSTISKKEPNKILAEKVELTSHLYKFVTNVMGGYDAIDSANNIYGKKITIRYDNPRSFNSDTLKLSDLYELTQKTKIDTVYNNIVVNNYLFIGSSASVKATNSWSDVLKCISTNGGLVVPTNDKFPFKHPVIAKDEIIVYLVFSNK